MDFNINVYDKGKGYVNRKFILIFILAIILLAFLAVSTYTYTRKNEPVKKEPPTPSVAMDSMYIFSPKDNIKLVQKVMEVNADISEKQKADEIINALKKEGIVPDKLTLYDIATDGNGVMYLNLSKEILDDKNLSSDREIIMTCAIVNTFISNYKDINKVQLLVEGHTAETINGVMYIYKPMEFNKDLLED